MNFLCSLDLCILGILILDIFLKYELIQNLANFHFRECLYTIYLNTFSYTGCPNKHGNSVTNSISSFQIILWFSIVIPTEKAMICKSFVCYVHITFVNVLTALRRHYRHVFTVFYPFHKINSSRHNNIIAFEIRYYNANS